MENQLQIIVKESGLDQTKADYILTQFQDYFELASEWERKAKTIVVTNEKQEVDMKMARTGRLYLREKRIAVEESRKKLKEQCLREGKAIDGIANVLKALIVPIEEYLEKQEKFIEFKQEAEREAKRIEIEKRMAEEEIARAKAEAEERERIKLENERLKKEAEEKEKALQAERIKVEAEKQAAERKAKAEQDSLKKEAEEKLLEERRITNEKFKAEQAKAFAEVEQVRKLNEEKLVKERRLAEFEAERIRKTNEEKLEKEQAERRKLEEELKNQIECPHCHKKFSLKK